MTQKQASFLLFVTLSFFTFTSKAQIIDKSIYTGLVGVTNPCTFDLYYDSLAVVIFNEKVPNDPVERLRMNIYRISDLSLKSSFYLNHKNSAHPADNAYSTLGLNQNYVFTSVAYIDSSIITLTRFHDGLDSVHSTFRKKVLDFRALNGGIIDNELYILFDHSSFTGDSTLLMATDLSLNTKRTSVDYWGKNGIFNNDSIMPPFYLGPYAHPTNHNRIVYGSSSFCVTVEVDKQTLELKQRMPRENRSTLKFSSRGLRNYHLFPDKVMTGGTGDYLAGSVFNGVNLWQGYFISRDWEGKTISERRFGDTTISECSFAYDYDIPTETHFLVSSTPCDDYRATGPEYRSLKIHRFNQWGHDTLFLYGDKNNMTWGVKPASNGDLFLLTTYTNAWSNDSSYVLLTKIPGFAFSLVDDKNVSPKIHLYPNPAQDFLNTTDFMGKAESLEIYNAAGKLLKTCTITEEEPLIDITDIPKGTLVVVVSTNSGEHYTSLVLKN